MNAKYLWMVIPAFLLAGCGTVLVEGEVLDPTEATSRNMIPTQVAVETSQPTVDEPVGPIAEGVLPAPVIYLGAEDEPVAPGKQNLWRMEVDGVTATQITDEVVPITSFAVSSVNGAIAYTTFSENDLIRIEADGGAREVLFDGVDLTSQPSDATVAQTSNANVAWSPDGSQIAFGYGGINVIPAVGGEPRVLLADKIVGEGPSQEARYYRPLAWSPDGTKILALEGYGIEGSGYAVVDVASGEVVSLGTGVRCCEPSWSLDGRSFYFSSPVFGMITPGLWQANAATGEVTTIIRGMESAGLPDVTGEPMSLIQSARQLSDGYLYAFSAFGSYDDLFRDEYGNESIAKLTMSRISPDGSEVTALRSDAYAFGDALWAQDGSGAVITAVAEGDTPSGALIWLKCDDSEAVVLGGRGFQPRWGVKSTAASTVVETTEARYGAGLSPTFAGLVYSTEEGLWLVEADGRSRFLIDQPDGAVSPGGTKVAYSQGEVEDLWLADLVTGERRNLSNSPDRREALPQWWPAHPEMIVFGSQSAEEDLFVYGYPTVVNLDGSGYRLLDERLGGPSALSPDGKTIAYGCCDGPGVLYNWPEGPTTFDPADYGATISKLLKPEWSPDGSRLAWMVAGNLTSASEYQMAIAVFDIGVKNFQYIHLYAPVGGAMVPHYLAWSPDGNWLAFTAYGDRPELGRELALWVARADGQEEHYLGVGFNPLWIPDGNWLVFNEAKDSPASIWDHVVRAVPFADWENSTVLPIDADLEGWIEG
jgi:Tol biopolymer transport system component